jgi:hypothetical protein
MSPTPALRAAPGPDLLLGMTLEWRPEPRAVELIEALNFWTTKARAGLPRRADLTPREMLPFLPFVHLYQLADDGSTFTIRLMGTGVRPLFDRDLTGTSVERPAPGATDNTATLNRRMFAVFDALQTQPMPLLASVPRTVIEKLHGQPIATLFLPLSNDGVRVDMVLAVTDVPRPEHFN